MTEQCSGRLSGPPSGARCARHTDHPSGACWQHREKKPVELQPWPWVTVWGLRTHNGAPWTRPATDADLERMPWVDREKLQPRPDIEGAWAW